MGCCCRRATAAVHLCRLLPAWRLFVCAASRRAHALRPPALLPLLAPAILLLQHQKDCKFREQLKQGGCRCAPLPGPTHPPRCACAPTSQPACSGHAGAHPCCSMLCSVTLPCATVPAPAEMHRLRQDVAAADRERSRLEGRLAAKEREIGGLANKVRVGVAGGSGSGLRGAVSGREMCVGRLGDGCTTVRGDVCRGRGAMRAHAFTRLVHPAPLPSYPPPPRPALQAKALGEAHKEDLKTARRDADELQKKVRCGGAGGGWRRPAAQFTAAVPPSYIACILIASVPRPPAAA